MTVHLITHPEVVIDPAVPVPDWPLSAVGVQRMRLAAGRPWLAGVRSIFTSTERKAMDAAGLLAETLGIDLVVIEDLGENNRSATGYLPKADFEAVAADAQRRVVGTVERALFFFQSETVQSCHSQESLSNYRSPTMITECSQLPGDNYATALRSL